MIGFVGFDPVIVPPLFARVSRYKRVRKRMKHKMPIAARAGRRRSEFESADAAFENYKGRGAFKAVNDDILKDYLKGGVIPHGSGVKLACDPAWEQAIFCAQSHKTFKALKTLPKSSRFILAGKNSPTPRIIQKRVAHPDKAAKALEAMIDKVFN